MTPIAQTQLPSAALPLASAPAGRKPFQIPSLDGLRAVSFFVVFLGHAFAKRWIPGDLGLIVFFFLSGYLITTLLRLECDETGRINFRDFYLRRVLRIFPPLYLVLALDCLLTLTHVLDNALWPQAVLFQVCHLTNYWIVFHGWWYGLAPGSWIFWSLAVEEHFYLVFPLLYLAMRRRGLPAKQQALVLLGLCAAVLLWRCVLVFGMHAAKDRLYVATDTRVDSILFGCILAVWGNPALDPAWIAEKRLKSVWLPMGFVALAASFAIPKVWPGFEQTFRYTLQGLALFPIFIAAIRFPNWGVFRWLNVGWVRTAGLLSYSLYLLHTTVLYGLHYRLHGPDAPIALLALAVSVALAALIYVGVEKPCGRLRRRLSHVLAGRRMPKDSAAAPNDAEPPGRSARVARNVVTTLATQLLSWAMSFGVMIVVTRYVGASGLGTLTLAASFAGVFGIGMTLGTSTVLTRDIARDTSRTAELTLAALMLRVPLGLTCVGLGWGMARAFGYSPSLCLLIGVALAALLVALLNDALAAALRGLQEVPRQNAAALADKAILSVLSVVLVSRHAPLWMLAGAPGVSALAALVINASAFKPYWKHVPWPGRPQIASLARQGLPFLTMAVFIAVYGNCDAVLMKQFSSLDAIGWYGLAKRLGGTTLFIPVALTGALLPALSRAYGEDRTAFDGAVQRMFNFVIICAVPFAAVLVMAPGRIIALVTSNMTGFAPAAPVLMILGAAIVLWFMSQAAATALIASDRHAALSRITAVSALICVPVTGTLIFLTQRTLHNGAVGAIAGDALIEGYMVAAYLRALPPGFVSRASFGTLGRAAAAALPLVGLFYFVHGRSDLLLLVPGLLLYIPLCWLLRCLHPQDVQMMRQIVKGRIGA